MKHLKKWHIAAAAVALTITACVAPHKAPAPATPTAPVTQADVNRIWQIAQRIGPPDIYPPAFATGATNPDITQETIAQTICNPQWSTKSIRPPASYTTQLKIKQLQQLAYADQNTKDFEEDHLISLELGGNPTDPANLWPEPYNASIADGGAKNKDKVENYLHAQVCSGALTLQEAQQKIVNDWYAVYKSMNGNLGAATDQNDQ